MAGTCPICGETARRTYCEFHLKLFTKPPRITPSGGPYLWCNNSGRKRRYYGEEKL